MPKQNLLSKIARRGNHSEHKKLHLSLTTVQIAKESNLFSHFSGCHIYKFYYDDFFLLRAKKDLLDRKDHQEKRDRKEFQEHVMQRY